MSDVYEKIMDLSRRRGFIWPASECYGSVAGFIDYGPLGSMMKRNIENTWRRFYIVQEGFYEIECPTIGHEEIFIHGQKDCQSCHRGPLNLINGRCECCRWYADVSVDEGKSARARRARGGKFDWVRLSR